MFGKKYQNIKYQKLVNIYGSLLARGHPSMTERLAMVMKGVEGACEAADRAAAVAVVGRVRPHGASGCKGR